MLYNTCGREVLCLSEPPQLTLKRNHSTKVVILKKSSILNFENPLFIYYLGRCSAGGMTTNISGILVGTFLAISSVVESVSSFPYSAHYYVDMVLEMLLVQHTYQSNVFVR